MRKWEQVAHEMLKYDPDDCHIVSLPRSPKPGDRRIVHGVLVRSLSKITMWVHGSSINSMYRHWMLERVNSDTHKLRRDYYEANKR